MNGQWRLVDGFALIVLLLKHEILPAAEMPLLYRRCRRCVGVVAATIVGESRVCRPFPGVVLAVTCGEKIIPMSHTLTCIFGVDD